MVKQAVAERRQCVRAKQIMSIQFRLFTSLRRNISKSWGLSTTQDISTDGIAFYTDREYCKGDVLEIHVVMSGFLDIYRGYGKVIRMERKKSGVCYLAAVKCIDKEQVSKRNKLRCQTVKGSRKRRGL